MDLGLTDARTMVAGGSAGIGLASARLLLEEGAKVALVGRDEGRVHEAARELAAGGGADGERILAIAADMTRADEVERAVDRVVDAWGGIDALVDAVGSGHRGLLRDVTPEEWEENWRANVLSAALLARAVASAMAGGGGGSMVFLGAASGKQPTPGQLVSNVHKAGLMAFVTTLAQELAPAGIRVNLVAPGRSMSPRRMLKARATASERGITVDDYFAELTSAIPAGRLAEPEEIAALAVFLTSRWSGYLTGQSIAVDGGLVRSIL